MNFFIFFFNFGIYYYSLTAKKNPNPRAEESVRLRISDLISSQQSLSLRTREERYFFLSYFLIAIPTQHINGKRGFVREKESKNRVEKEN